MKYSILILAVVVVANLGSMCKKEPAPPLPPDPIDTIVVPIDTHIIELGKVTMKRDGVIWSPPFKAWFEKNDSSFVITTKINTNDNIQRTFYILDIPLQKGKYEIKLDNSITAYMPNLIPLGLYILMYDGDQLIGGYEIDTTRTDHYVEVIDYDPVTHIAEGRFQMYMVKDLGAPFPGVNDKIEFTEGKFRLEVKEF